VIRSAREPVRRRKRGEGVAVELDEPSPQEGEPEVPAFALNDVLHLRLGQSVLQRIASEGVALCRRGERGRDDGHQEQAHREKRASRDIKSGRGPSKKHSAVREFAGKTQGKSLRV
jgi:hypothetical protein